MPLAFLHAGGQGALWQELGLQHATLRKLSKEAWSSLFVRPALNPDLARQPGSKADAWHQTLQELQGRAPSS